MTDIGWPAGPMVGFDLETTGVDRATARIVTASTVWIEPGQQPVMIHEWLANPGIPIPAEASAIHGITTDHARTHGMNHSDVLYEVIEDLGEHVLNGRPLVVFNAPYDLTLIDVLARATDDIRPLVDLDTDGQLRVIDPLVMDRRMDPYRRGPRKLTHLCQQVYEVPLSDADAHGSSADALAACRLAWKLGYRYPQLARMSLRELHDNQTRWYSEWATKFRAYLEGQGKKVTDLDGMWPYTPPTEPVDALFDAPAAPAQHGLL